MQGPLKLWQGVLTRWSPCHALLKDNHLQLACSGRPVLSLQLSSATVVPVLDDPLRIMIRSGTTVVNLRASTPEDRIKWARHLLQGKQNGIEMEIRKAEGTSNTEKSELDAVTIEIWKAQSELSDLVVGLLPRLRALPEGAETANRIIKVSGDLKRSVAEAIKIVQRKMALHEVPVFQSQSKQSLEKSGMHEIDISSVRQGRDKRPPSIANLNINTNNPEQFSVYSIANKSANEDFYDIKQITMNNGQQDDTSFQSFMDEGYDGLEESRATNEWKINRVDSFNKESLGRVSDRILKKKILTENPVFRALSNPISSETKRMKLPCVMNSEQINLLGVIKGVIGSDIFNLNLPIITHEPLTTLQKLSEQMIFEQLLVQANLEQDSSKRVLYVLGFAISGYWSTANRTKLPFKPVLGQTYEYTTDKFKYISEQVQHNTSAFHCESQSYIVEGSLTLDYQFTGKSIQVVPKGHIYVVLKRPQHLICYTQCPTKIRNLIFGSVQLHNLGEMTLSDEKSNISFMKFKDKSFLFDDSHVNQIEGWLKNAGVIKYTLDGIWDRYLEANDVRIKTKTRIWESAQKRTFPEYYGFSQFTMNLNLLNSETLHMVPTTDSRLRPDVRALENGLVQLGEAEKTRIYKKEKGQDEEGSWLDAFGTKSKKQGHSHNHTQRKPIKPRWFDRELHRFTKEHYYRFNETYWHARDRQDWPQTYDLF